METVNNVIAASTKCNIIQTFTRTHSETTQKVLGKTFLNFLLNYIDKYKKWVLNRLSSILVTDLVGDFLIVSCYS